MMQHMEYVYLNCFSFRNALFIVTGPAPRWKCPNYHPERTLLAPASAYQLSNPRFWKSANASQSRGSDREQRTMFMYYKATCLQKPLDENFTEDDVMLFKVVLDPSYLLSGGMTSELLILLAQPFNPA